MTSPSPKYWLWNKERISPLKRWRYRWAIIKVLLEYACYLLMYEVDSSSIEYMTRRFTVEGAQLREQYSTPGKQVDKTKIYPLFVERFGGATNTENLLFAK